jgi:hypothetical protein
MRDYFLFGSVFIKEITKLIFLKKTKTELKPVQIDLFRFGSVRFFRTKPVQTGLTRFSRFDSVFSVFSGFGSVFSGFGSVFSVGLGLVRFFRVFAYKTKTEPNRPVFSKF